MRHLRRPATALLLALSLAAAARAQEQRAPDAVPFDELFVLDRAKALAKLIPGSADHFHYTALDAQVKGEWDKAQAIVDAWEGAARRGVCPWDARLQTMRNRQWALLWGKDSARASRELIRHLGLGFGHGRPGKDAPWSAPSALAADALDQDRSVAAWLASDHRGLDAFDDASLPLLAGKHLGAGEVGRDRAHQLLERLGNLHRPDFPGVVGLIAADMAHWPGFGQRGLDGQLTKAQLEELAKLRPTLLGDENYVEAYAVRLRPRDGSDAGRDPQAQMAYLDALTAFARTLPPNAASFKAAALFQKLEALQLAGQHDLALLKEYLELPRHSPILLPAWREDLRRREVPLADLNRSCFIFPPILPREDKLVRRELLFFLGQDAAQTKTDFAQAPELDGLRERVNRDYLLRLYAEARLLAGCPDPDAVYRLLPPAEAERLRDRVDVDLLPHNARQVAADAVPELKLALKNVEKLSVRVHKVDLAAYYRATGEELDPSVELDGQLPAVEKEVDFAGKGPFLRHETTLKLEELKEPGAYVVEVVGNGKSARAVILKGRLHALCRPSAAGHLVLVRDEAGQPVAGAHVALGALTRATDGEGRAVIPYTRADKETGLQKAVVTAGPLAALLPFEREKETPRLVCAFDAARESLIAGAAAPVVMTPRFTLNGQPADLSLLEGWWFEAQFTLQDGTQVSRRVDDLKPDAQGRLALKLEVPAGATAVGGRLHAKLPGEKPEDEAKLAAGFGLPLGSNSRTRGLFTRKDGEATVLELRGANGEPLVGERVEVWFAGGVSYGRGTQALKTDAKGQVRLGVLPRGVSFQASAGDTRTAGGNADQRVIPGLLNVAAGANLRLPGAAASRWKPALHELRGGEDAHDLSAKLQQEEGALLVPGLPAGDYRLTLEDQRQVLLRVEDGPRAGSLVLGRDRILDAAAAGEAATFAGWAVDGDHLVLRFSGKPDSVTLASGRFGGDGLAIPALDLPAYAAVPTPLDCQYLNGRVLDDEYRYVLERRKSAPLAGNLLARPGLLLNPWEVRTTTTRIQQVSKGEAGEKGYRQKAPAEPAVVTKRMAKEIAEGIAMDGMVGTASGAFVDYDAAGSAPAFRVRMEGFVPLDFLATPAWTRGDLLPDAKGEIRIPLSALGDGNLLRVAAVSGATGWSRELALPLTEIKRRELRLMKPLDAGTHLAETRAVKWGAQDAKAAGGPRIETLAQYYQLLTALNPGLGADYAAFEPLTRWPELKDEAKLDFYKKQACHELHFFLWRKDQAFFAAHIKPFLANKKDKTLVDKALLGEPLAEYLRPEAFARLNAFERALLAQATKDAPLVRREADEAGQLPVDVNFLDRVFRTAMANADAPADKSEESESVRGRKRLDGGGFVGAADDAWIAGGAPPAPAAAPAPKPERLTGMTGMTGMAGKDMRDEAQLRLEYKKGKNIPLYRDPGAAKEWAENNWWKTPVAQVNANLIPTSTFWADFAKGDAPSENFLLAHRNLHEALLALGAVDLPFKAAKDAKEAKVAVIQSDLRPDAAPAKEVTLVQRFFRADDRQAVEKGRARLKVHAGPFRPGVVYGCEVVVSNATDVARELSLLTQIPQGALPVGGKATDAKPVQVQPFGSWRGEYLFYFPEEGDFTQYPAHAGENGQVVGFGDAAAFAVSRTAPAPIADAWVKTAAEGTEEEVLRFLETRDLAGLDLSLCAWMMRDKGHYNRVIAALMQRHYYNPVLWSYGLLHQDTPATKAFLEASAFANEVGGWLDAPVLQVDATQRGAYEHLEYMPFINARMLQLGKERTIPNEALRAQYGKLLEVLRYKGHWALTGSRFTDGREKEQEDHLALAYYLALQDRTADAMARLGSVSPDDFADPTGSMAALQYDYLRAYLLFSQEKPEEARKIAEKYKDLAIPHWKEKFAAVITQANEITKGTAVDAADPAALAPVLEAEWKDARLAVSAKNAGEVKAALYPVDLEVMFSRAPFAVSGGAQAPFVKPAHTLPVAVDAKGEAVLELPADFAKRNLIVEVSAGGLRRTLVHQPHDFQLRLLETQGQLQVLAADGKPIPKAYVKVYAKRNGQAVFHKDGTTDLRGRFDYASLNTGFDGVEGFAVLVVAPGNQGAVVREAKTPAR